jgi:cystathionine beta-lyase
MRYNFDEPIERKGTECIKWDGMEQFLGSSDALPLWVADMDFLTPDFITQAIQQRAAHSVFGYPLRGEGYFNSLASWLLRRHQWNVETDWIRFSPGVVPAINLAVLAYTQPGDRIIVQPPVYFPFFTAVTDHNRTLVYNQLKLDNGRLCMDFAQLEQLAAEGAKMLIISNPHNPGGSVWTPDELSKLAAICLKHNVIMISDEIHCDLVYPQFKHTPLAGISPGISMNTVTIVAPSKTFNLSGLSTSSVIIENKELRLQFDKQLDKLHIGGGNIFGNIASEAAYNHGDEYVDSLMDYLLENVNFLENYYKQHLPQIKIIRPEATFLVWLDCRELNLNDKELNNFFLHKAKLGLNPGIMFGPGGEGFMRLNIGCPRKSLETAMSQLHKAISTHN